MWRLNKFETYGSCCYTQAFQTVTSIACEFQPGRHLQNEGKKSITFYGWKREFLFQAQCVMEECMSIQHNLVIECITDIEFAYRIYSRHKPTSFCLPTVNVTSYLAERKMSVPN